MPTAMVSLNPPNHNNSNKKQQNSLDELRKCKQDVLDAERRVAAAIESRDACAAKLEEAADEIAELQRKKEVQNHFQQILAREIQSKDRMITEAAEKTSRADKYLNTVRENANRLANTIIDKEKETKAAAKTATQLEHVLNSKSKENDQLKRKLTDEKSQQITLHSQIKTLHEEKLALRQELDVVKKQLHLEEGAHEATKAALRTALNELSDAQRTAKAMQSSATDAAALRVELAHLGKELLREQKLVADQEAQLIQRKKQQQLKSSTASDDHTCSINSLNRKLALLQKRLMIDSEKVIQQEKLVKKKNEEIKRLERMVQRRGSLSLSTAAESEYCTDDRDGALVVDENETVASC